MSYGEKDFRLIHNFLRFSQYVGPSLNMELEVTRALRRSLGSTCTLDRGTSLSAFMKENVSTFEQVEQRLTNPKGVGGE